MKKIHPPTPVPSGDVAALFDRVASILEPARDRVVHAVNHETVTAYWLIGREIVETIQGGESRAEYGKRVLGDLSARLCTSYGKGFSVTNLWYFRQFYQAYADRQPQIAYPAGGQSEAVSTPPSIPHPLGGELTDVMEFHPSLSWSHYRALMRLDKRSARQFYEIEAVQANWSRRELERQINNLFYERLLASSDKAAMLEGARKFTTPLTPLDMLKDPYVLEFLDLPQVPQLHERQLEQAIIDKLQHFLLELGRGFSFVARQKRMRFEDQDFYVDLVFYNYLLKCFVLIDLKIGELTHQDIGQMDGYVRMYEAHSKVEGDNPTIGLILCSEKNAAVAL